MPLFLLYVCFLIQTPLWPKHLLQRLHNFPSTLYLQTPAACWLLTSIVSTSSPPTSRLPYSNLAFIPCTLLKLPSWKSVRTFTLPNLYASTHSSSPTTFPLPLIFMPLFLLRCRSPWFCPLLVHVQPVWSHHRGSFVLCFPSHHWGSLELCAWLLLLPAQFCKVGQWYP